MHGSTYTKRAVEVFRLYSTDRKVVCFYKTTSFNLSIRLADSEGTNQDITNPFSSNIWKISRSIFIFQSEKTLLSHPQYLVQVIKSLSFHSETNIGEGCGLRHLLTWEHGKKILETYYYYFTGVLKQTKKPQTHHKIQIQSDFLI